MKDSKKIIGIALLGGAGLMLLTPKGQEMLASLGGAGGGIGGEETAIAGKEQEYKIIETQEVPTPAPTFVFQTPEFKGIFKQPSKKERTYTSDEIRLPRANGGRIGSYTGGRGYTAKKITQTYAPTLTPAQQTAYSKLVSGQLRRFGYHGGGYVGAGGKTKSSKSAGASYAARRRRRFGRRGSKARR